MCFNVAYRSRIAPCLIILAVAGMTALAVTIPAWHVARKSENERHFLKTFRTPFDSEAFFTYCMDYATASSEANDVVFLGGSTCLCGIRTIQFEGQTGLTAYNLGTIGMLGSKGHVLLLRAYLAHHPVPRLVVLCVQPREAGPWRLRRGATEAETPARAASVAERFFWCYGEPGRHARPRHSESVAHYVGQGILMGLGEARGGLDHYLSEPTRNLGGFSYNDLKRKVRADRGFYSFGGTRTLSPTASSDPSKGELLPAVGATLDDPFPVLPEFDEAIRGLARIASDRGTRLMIRLSPDLIGIDPEQCGRIRRCFDRLEADYANVVCERPEIVLYGPECFSDDNCHLNLRGAEKFTALVASQVLEALQTLPAGDPTDSASERSASPADSNADRPKP